MKIVLRRNWFYANDPDNSKPVALAHKHYELKTCEQRASPEKDTLINKSL